jgi:hypothetical protein
MLVGYNTNVTYKGTIYHVQTEDNGLKNPVIITLLYHKGSILSSKKISYAQFASGPDYKKKVRELMKEQHKSMLKELVRGKHTGDSSEVQSDEAGTDEAEKKFVVEGDSDISTSKNLDDILIDYIIKKKKHMD